VVLYCADGAWVVWPVTDGRLEDDALVVALALAFRFDAVAAGWSFFAALDAAFAACQAASLGPFSHLVGVCSGC
jgi:hypothetical protein